MKIVADANIIAVAESLQRFGEVVLIPGREITRDDLVDADALLVRSITKVDESLLAGTAVKFVATATSGTDHVDVSYLQRNNIAFADAKGSNANAVVDYCFAALFFALSGSQRDIAQLTVGLVGGGRVGSLFAKKLQALGVSVRICDPPLAALGGDYSSLDEVLSCDVVSLHVPLTEAGDYPTVDLIDAEKLSKLATNSLLINSCRGGVVNEADLFEMLKRRGDVCTVFDVWCDEPVIKRELAVMVDIATPHIAGYSQQAKLAATVAVCEALEAHFHASNADDANKERHAEASAANLSAVDVADSVDMSGLLEQVLPIKQLSEELKASLGDTMAAAAFDGFRKRLLQRLEFQCYSVRADNLSVEMQAQLKTIGFHVAP